MFKEVDLLFHKWLKNFNSVVNINYHLPEINTYKMLTTSYDQIAQYSVIQQNEMFLWWTVWVICFQVDSVFIKININALYENKN